MVSAPVCRPCTSGGHRADTGAESPPRPAGSSFIMH